MEDGGAGAASKRGRLQRNRRRRGPPLPQPSFRPQTWAGMLLRRAHAHEAREGRPRPI
jgi:hypothetical protein